MDIPVYATTQNSARLGATVPELASIFPSETRVVDKTAFSMMVPGLVSQLMEQSQQPHDHTNATAAAVSGRPEPVTVLLMGIETHICVLQTTLDLLSLGHQVYVLADAVSSCNAGERGISLARMAREGAVITTSESVLFELVGDAASPNFKQVANLVKETKEQTAQAVKTFCEGVSANADGVGEIKN